jgi:hypothetical protein
MRNSILVLLCMASVLVAAPCPIQGDGKGAVALLNALKNRDPRVATNAKALALQSMLAPGDDTNRFDASKIASITGYVIRVIPGGIESCNCHAQDTPHRDTHIYVVADAKHANPSQCVIVEVTPRSRNWAATSGKDWSTATLNKTLVGHTVTFTGFLLFDSEHKQNAINTSPNNKHDWRATAWEVHPTIGIKIQD